MEENQTEKNVRDPCAHLVGKERIECLKEMEEIEDRKMMRKTRYWIMRYVLVSIFLLVLVFGTTMLYGYMFSDKQFMEDLFLKMFAEYANFAKIVIGP